MIQHQSAAQLSLRKMNREDLPAALELEAASFDDPWPPEAFSDDIIEHAYLLLKDEAIIGYAFVMMVLDECSLLNVAVSPAEQRKGYGHFMMQELIAKLYNGQAIRYFYLDVRSSNLAAQGLYTKLGFTQLGIRKSYYRKPPEDAIVMGLILPPLDKTKEV